MAGATTSYLVPVVPLIAAGFGMAFTMPAATAAIIEAAPADRAGIASGVLNAARQAGGAIGAALLGTLIAGQSFVPGMHAAMGVSAASFLAGALVTAIWVERRHAEKRSGALNQVPAHPPAHPPARPPARPPEDEQRVRHHGTR